MAKKNGHSGTEALLEKIIEEFRGLKTELVGFRADSNLRMDRMDAKLERMDVRLELMTLGYRDLRDRVSELEKKP